ncbi:MAG: hypothetical protein J1E37_05405 [Prevotella sp.]|nr:hypothetical protein [Prevotella sp.]
MRQFLSSITALAALLLLTACDVHQWPEPRYDYDFEVPEPPTPRITVPIRLEYETDFYLWEHKYDPLLGKVEEANPSLTLFPEFPGTSEKYDNTQSSGQIQVYIKVFPSSDPTRCVAEQTFVSDINGTYDTDLQLEVPSEDTYDVVVWSQLLQSPQAQPFYNALDFSRIRIISDNYRGSTNYRDGFRGRIRIDAATKTYDSYVVRMKRPMGKFELVTTDLSEFLEKEGERRGLSARADAADYRVIISFPYFYPNSYSAMDDRLENSISGISFETSMRVTGDSEASLGFEYVMLNNINDNGVQTRVDVYRLDGTHVAGSAMFTIPMRRDNHTLLRGAFLSLENSGGVGIDPGFNGDHNVTWQ